MTYIVPTEVVATFISTRLVYQFRYRSKLVNIISFKKYQIKLRVHLLC